MEIGETPETRKKKKDDRVYSEPRIGENIVDHWFGPRAFTREIAEEYFMKSDRKMWDWIILPSAKAQVERGTTV